MEFPGSLNRWQVAYNHPIGNIYHLYTSYIFHIAFWGVICYLPPFMGTRNNHWSKRNIQPQENFRANQPASQRKTTPWKINGRTMSDHGGLVQIIFLAFHGVMAVGSFRRSSSSFFASNWIHKTPNIRGWYCWWFRNPANQLRLVVYTIIYKVLYIPGGYLGFLPSTVVQNLWSHHVVGDSNQKVQVAALNLTHKFQIPSGKQT